VKVFHVLLKRVELITLFLPFAEDLEAGPAKAVIAYQNLIQLVAQEVCSASANF